MTRDYVGHWIIGICATLVWFWGAKVDIPASAINLAAWIVPGLLAHALGQSAFKGNSLPVSTKDQTTSAPEPIIISAAGPINVPQEPQA